MESKSKKPKKTTDISSPAPDTKPAPNTASAPENKPASPTPPANASTNPDKPIIGAGVTKVIKADPKNDFGWKAHSLGVDAAGVPILEHKKSWIHNHWIVGGIAIAIVVVLLGGALVFIKPRPAAIVQKDSSIDLQSVGDNLLKGFSGVTGNQAQQTLQISANSLFKNSVTVDKALTVKGALNADGDINGARNLNISGSANYNDLNVRTNLQVVGTTLLQGNVEARNQLTVRGTFITTGSANVGGNLNVTGALNASSFTTSNLTVGKMTLTDTLTVNGHIVSAGAAPSVSPGSIIGGGSARVEGSDMAGTVTINTGNVGAGVTDGVLATVTFRKPYGQVPRVVISPVGMSAGKLEFYTSRTSTYFTVSTASRPDSNKSFSFDYIIIE